MRRLPVVAAGLIFAAAPPAAADEFRPAYLQLHEVDGATYDVLWKLPALDESLTLAVAPEFPPGTTYLTPVHSSYAAGASVRRWRIRADGGLNGKAIRFPSLAIHPIDVLVRLERADGSAQLGRVMQYDARFEIVASPARFEVAKTYTLLGIQHILTGFDHLLFVTALLILVRGPRRLLATITTFTLAHSLTLVAATTGWVHAPGPPVEASIALSIVFVAAEIVHARRGRASLAQRYPWLIAFAFGLLHGLGFAGALSEVGLPQLAVPTALLFFNIGVEVGQLIFIGAVFAGVSASRSAARWLRLAPPPWLWRVPPYLIGSLASCWVMERVAAF